MATSHFQQFLHDATSSAPDTDIPLGTDRLWRINVHHTPPRMKGRAAAEYILASYPYTR